MAIEDDDKPRKKVTHEIGQDLSLLSVEELTERIALMTSEIERLQAGDDQEARLEGRGEQLFQVVSRASDLSPRVVPTSWPSMRRDPSDDPYARGFSLQSQHGALACPGTCAGA